MISSLVARTCCSSYTLTEKQTAVNAADLVGAESLMRETLYSALTGLQFGRWGPLAA